VVQGEVKQTFEQILKSLKSLKSWKLRCFDPYLCAVRLDKEPGELEADSPHPAYDPASPACERRAGGV